MRSPTIPLRQAGYRELVYAKAMLEDYMRPFRVRLEGSASLAILLKFGHDDADCHPEEEPAP